MTSRNETSMVETTIIVVNWNTCDLTCSCLESIAHHSAGLNVDTVVVDNASSDGSQACIRERFPWVRLIVNEINVGFARANNQAIRATESEFILLLNSDAELLPGTLRNLVACLRAHPEAAVAGARLLNPDGSFQASYAQFPSLVSEALALLKLAPRVYGRYFPSAGPEDSLHTTRADWVGGACMLVRRATLQHVGLMDEAYFMYSEEMDWCYAMHRAGWAIYYCADAAVVHYGGQSVQQVNERKLAMLYRSKLRFFHKNYGRGQFFMLRLMIALSSFVKVVVTILDYMVDQRSRKETMKHVRAQWNALWLSE